MPKEIGNLMDYGYPRDEIQKTHFLLTPGSDGPMTSRMRLVAESCMPEKYHRIDGIFWGKRMEAEPRGSFPDSVVGEEPPGEDVTATLSIRRRAIGVDGTRRVSGAIVCRCAGFCRR